MASKTDKSKRIRSKGTVAKNQPGNASPLPATRARRYNPPNMDIPDPSGLDDTKANAGRIIER